jgi:hypothetical protein
MVVAAASPAPLSGTNAVPVGTVKSSLTPLVMTHPSVADRDNPTTSTIVVASGVPPFRQAVVFPMGCPDFRIV